ncbi:MAG: hypothetical protein ACTSYO_07125 [Candidatus Ranarchaeia archaeon]
MPKSSSNSTAEKYISSDTPSINTLSHLILAVFSILYASSEIIIVLCGILTPPI